MAVLTPKSFANYRTQFARTIRAQFKLLPVLRLICSFSSSRLCSYIGYAIHYKLLAPIQMYRLNFPFFIVFAAI